MLVAAGRSGLTPQLLAACGFGAGIVAALVNKGFATLTHEKVQAQAAGKMIEVGKVRITDSGRDALGRGRLIERRAPPRSRSSNAGWAGVDPHSAVVLLR